MYLSSDFKMDGGLHQGSNSVYESLEEEEDDETEDSESDNAVPLTGKSSITSQVSSTHSGIRVKSATKKKKPTKKKRSRILANLAATKFSISMDIFYLPQFNQRVVSAV